MDRVHEGRIEVRPGDCRELGADSQAVEADQVESLDAPGALQLGQEWQQRMASMELVRAVGEDQDDGHIPDVAHEETQQVAGRTIRPVEIFQDQHDGLVGCEPLEHGQDDLEQSALGRSDVQAARGVARPLAPGRRETRHEAGKVGSALSKHRVDDVFGGVSRPCPQGFDDRGVWRAPFAEIDTAAREHERTRRASDVSELAYESRLADACLAADQELQALTIPGAIERRPQTTELLGPSHEDRARDANVHRRIIRAPGDRWRTQLQIGR